MPITKASGNSVTAAAKGDLVVGNATNDSGVLSVGANNTVLTADSSTATGVKWATASSGGMTLLSTTTLSGASTVISSIDQTYVNLFILVTGVTNATDNNKFYCQPNSASTTSWSALTSGTATSGEGNWTLTGNQDPTRTDANNVYALQIFNYASTSSFKSMSFSNYFQVSGNARNVSGGAGFYSNSAISSILFANFGGNLSGGTVRIYGVK